MSLPVSEEHFTFVIWSNKYLDRDNYRDAFEEDYSSLTDDEKYQLMCDLNNDYLDDERRNLDIQVGTPIIVIADVGRWDGRHTGYREISSGCIKDCLESQLDGVTWYVDGKGDFRMDGYIFLLRCRGCRNGGRGVFHRVFSAAEGGGIQTG